MEFVIRWFVRRPIDITLQGCFRFIHPLFSRLYIFEGSHDDLDRSRLPQSIGIHTEEVLPLLLAPVFWRSFDAPDIFGYEQRQTQEPQFFMFTERNAVHDAGIRAFPRRQAFEPHCASHLHSIVRAESTPLDVDQNYYGT